MQAHCYNNQAQHAIGKHALLDRPWGSPVFCTKRRITVLGIIALGMLLHIVQTPAVLAAEYQLKPTISSVASYNDNLTMNPTNEEALNGLELLTVVDFSYDDQISTVRLSTSANFDRFDKTRFDTDDQSASLFYQRLFEKGSMSVEAKTNHTSARTLEDLDTDIGSRETEATRADANNFTLSGLYYLTEKNLLRGSLSGSLRDYQSDNLASYAYYSANGLWQHSMNARLRLQMQASYSRYLPDDTLGLDFTEELLELAASKNVTGPDLDSRLESCLDAVGFIPIPLITVGIPNNNLGNPRAPCFDIESFTTQQNTVSLQLGFVYLIKEALSLNILAGRTETGSERDNISVEQRGRYVQPRKDHTASYEASLSYTGERLTSSISASQNEQATSDGVLNLTTRVSWRNDWNLSALSSLNLNFIWTNRAYDAELERVQFSDRENIYALAGYKYLFSHAWSGKLQYEYRTELKSSQRPQTERNRVMLTLAWSPMPKTWSR